MDVRRKFRKIYEDFRPACYYWSIVLMGRKFAFALTTLMLNETPSLQAAIAIGLLFVSYSLQMNMQPYLGRSSVPLARFANSGTTLAFKRRVLRKGRAFRKLARVAATESAQYIFNYNRLEAILLSSSIFVLLSGLIFEAASEGEANSGVTGLGVFVAVMLVAAHLLVLGSIGFEIWRSLKYTSEIKQLKVRVPLSPLSPPPSSR